MEAKKQTGNLIGQKIRQAEEYRVSAMNDLRIGRSPIGFRAAESLEGEARAQLVPGMEIADHLGAGAELVLNMSGPPGDPDARRLKDTVRDPQMVTAGAQLDRLRLAEAANVLDIALDAADTIEPKNNLERMLAHQLAASHQMAMRFAEIANAWACRADPSKGTFNNPLSAAPYMVEAQRAANTSARAMGAYQDGLATLAKIRGGGKQTVVVQHVQVNEGGQAVVAGKMGRGERKRRGG